MAGILANSATVTMTSGTPDASATGYLVGERITLTTNPTGSNYVWSIAKPAGSSISASSLTGTNGYIYLVPDVEGYFTVTVTVDTTTTYVLRVAAQAIGTVVYHSVSNYSPIANTSVPSPTLGGNLYYSSTADGVVYKKSDGSVISLLSANVGDGTITTAKLADNSVTAAKLDTKAAGYATYAEARAAITSGAIVAGDRVRVHGRLAMGDGGQGWFDCVNSSATDNGGTLLTAGGGTSSPHLKRDYSELAPEMFGAVGDGTTSDSTAVQACLDVAYTTGNPVRLSRLYAVSGINARGGYNITGDGYSSGFVGLSGYSYIIGVNYGSGGTTNPANNEKRATWSNFVVRGRSVADGFLEPNHNIVLSAATDFTLDRLWVEGNRGDGVYIGSGTTGGIERHNQQIVIRGCVFDGLNNSGRNGISVIDCDGLVVQGCKFFRTSTSGMPGAIDIEPDDTFNIIRNITVDGCEFDDVIGNVGQVNVVLAYAQSAFTVPPHGFTFSNLRFGASISGPTLVSVLGSNDATTSLPSLGLVVSNCSAYDSNCRAWNFNGVRGIRTENNTFSRLNGIGLIGYSLKVVDVELGETDTFFECGLVDSSGLSVAKASYVRIWSNFVNCGQADGLFGYAVDFSGGASTATSDNIDISRMRQSGARTLVAIQKEAGHTFTSNTNNGVGASLAAGSFFQSIYPGNQPFNMGKVRNINSTWLTPSSGATVDVSTADQVSFENYGTPTNITDFTSGSDGQLLLIKLSANATIVHNVSKIILQYGTDATGNSNNFILLERRDNLWREIARNFPRRISNVYTTPADATTTPSVAGYDNVDFSNYTTNTNVTNFTGGAQGQEIRCRMDPQVTLVHGSGLALKGATNVSARPQGDWITLRLYGGTWEETSRSW